MDNKIYLPIRKMERNSQGVIKITPEAMNALTEVIEDTGLSVRQAASMIIAQAVKKGMIQYILEMGDE